MMVFLKEVFEKVNFEKNKSADGEKAWKITQHAKSNINIRDITTTVLQAKSNIDVMFCLQSYQGFRINRSLVY